MTDKTNCKCSNCYYEFEARKKTIRKRRCPKCSKIIESVSKTIFLVTEIINILKLSNYGLKAKQIESQLIKRGIKIDDASSQNIVAILRRFPHIFMFLRYKGGYRWRLRCKDKV